MSQIPPSFPKFNRPWGRMDLLGPPAHPRRYRGLKVFSFSEITTEGRVEECIPSQAAFIPALSVPSNFCRPVEPSDTIRRTAEGITSSLHDWRMFSDPALSLSANQEAVQPVAANERRQGTLESINQSESPGQLIARIKRETAVHQHAADDCLPPPAYVTPSLAIKQEPISEERTCPVVTSNNNYSQSVASFAIQTESRDSTPQLNPEYAQENVYVAGFSIGVRSFFFCLIVNPPIVLPGP